VGHIEPSMSRFRDFVSKADEDAPIVMINLLRYRQQADYPEGFNADPCTGREAYQRYAEVAGPRVAKTGARAVWMGSACTTLIGPEDEVWDDAVLVEYPSKKAFLQMAMDPEYAAVAVHRTAALADSRLICSTPLLADFFEE